MSSLFYINTNIILMQITTFNDVLNAMPIDLREIVAGLESVQQSPIHHPEGNVLIHTKVVTSRAIAMGFNINVIVAAFFHDIGKCTTTVVSESGKVTAHGHERASALFVKMYSDSIDEIGADSNIVYWLVSQHMRVKRLDEMRAHKQQELRSHKWFAMLEQLAAIDRSGTDI